MRMIHAYSLSVVHAAVLEVRYAAQNTRTARLVSDKICFLTVGTNTNTVQMDYSISAPNERV